MAGKERQGSQQTRQDQQPQSRKAQQDQRPQSRQERRRQERSRAREKEAAALRAQPRRRWWLASGIVAVLVVVGGGGYFAFAQHNQPNQSNTFQAGSPIDGIQCGSMEGQAEHIHTHVALFWNGKPVTIPADVGIPYSQDVAGNYCFYWLHTHATSNVVHIEAPSSGTYTLGQFVDIWHYTSIWDSQSTIAQAPNIDASFANALRAAPASNVHVYVGDKLVATSYRDLTFADHKNVTVELGTPLKPPVATFDWQHWDGA